MIITNYEILPSYSRGFFHTWEVSQSLADPGPWRFQVEEAPAPDGPWTPVSGDVINMYAYQEVVERRVNKNSVLYFRIKLVTAKDTYFSATRMPYGDLDRREFLIGRDIMRKEILHMSKLAGTQGSLHLVSTFGPKCRVCRDPITDTVRDSKCKKCFGTGRDPAYHGPYQVWYTFSSAKRTTQLSPQGANTVEPAQYQVRMIGAPPVKKNDAIVDTGSGKRYYVDSVDNAAELRRVPLVQVLIVNEAPVTDALYKVL